MTGHGNAPTIGGVLATFARAGELFVRGEAHKAATLAQEELRQKAAAAGADAALVAAGGVLAYGGALTLLASAVLGLRRLGLPDWLAALVVGLVAAGGGAGLATTGVRRLRQADAVPHRTIQTVKGDVAEVTGL
jgi:methylmalonyl-CoA mutase cobalamin-binding subunit